MMANVNECCSVIVWESEGDIPGLFSPFSDNVSNYIEQEHTKDSTAKLNLGVADPHLKKYEVDLSSNVQTSAQRGTQRSIRRQVYADSTTIGSGIVWEWLTNNGWITYDIEAMDAIEKAFSNQKLEVDLQRLSFSLPNVVLVKQGYQRNKNTGCMRPIQRRAASYQDVATQKTATSGLPFSSSSVVNPVTTTKGENNKAFQITKFCSIATTVDEDEDCPICLCSLKGDSAALEQIVQLKKCKHRFHESCMEAFCKQGQQNGCIQCPVCKKIHGIKTGNQPPGRMTVSINMKNFVAGYEGQGMITISYHISPGIQGPEHPSPGSPYQTYGFPRTGYLPANEQGQKVLQLLKKAWERRLIFTIGQSTTTGIDNAVIWNEIHHKTSPHDDKSGHGFPDPSYLDNVTDELRQHGVTESSDE